MCSILFSHLYVTVAATFVESNNSASAVSEEEMKEGCSVSKTYDSKIFRYAKPLNKLHLLLNTIFPSVFNNALCGTLRKTIKYLTRHHCAENSSITLYINTCTFSQHG